VLILVQPLPPLEFPQQLPRATKHWTGVVRWTIWDYRNRFCVPCAVTVTVTVTGLRGP
jgi:hypothetical protein